MKNGKVYQRKGGSRWWIAYRAHGKEVRLSVASTLGIRADQVTEKHAWRLLREKLAELEQGRHLSATEMRVTVNDLLDNYISDLRLRNRIWKKADMTCRAVRDVLGAWRAIDVKTPLLKAYLQKRLDAGMAAATTANEMGILRSAFRLAHRENRFNVLPYFPSLTLDNARQGFVEPEQFTAIAAQLQQPYLDVASFSYLASRRINEVLKLPWAWVDRTGREIHWPKTKNGKRLTLPLEGGLWEIVERRWADRAIGQWLSPWVFHTTQRGALSYSAYLVHFTAAVTDVGLPHVRPHDFRRSGIRNMIRAGVERVVAKSISGHISDSVFDRYNITSTEDQQQAFRKIARYTDKSRDNRWTESGGTP